MNPIKIFLFLIIALVLASTVSALAVDIYTASGKYEFEPGEQFVIKADAENAGGLSLMQLYRYDGVDLTKIDEKNCGGKSQCDISHTQVENIEGTYYYYAYAFDMDLNYVYDSMEVRIYLEINNPPIIDITYPNNGDMVSGTITVIGTSSDPDTGDFVEVVEVSTDGINWNLATGTTSWQYSLDTITLNEGANTIYARAYDGELYGYDQVDVYVDNRAPIVTGAQARPDSYTDVGEYDNDYDIYFTWTASDNFALDRCYAELNGFPPDEDAGLDFQDTDTGFEGLNTYHVRCYDTAGNFADDSDTIYIDTQAPTASIIINNDDAYTNTVDVTLTLTYQDSGSDVMDCRYRNAGQAWTSWETCIPTRAWTLTTGDGTKIVEYEVRDNALNSVVVSDSIILDTQAPTDLSIIINNGDEYTSSVNVDLTLSATDADQCRYRNEGEVWIAYEPYTTFRLWTLTAGEGLKTVYYQCVDLANNPSAVVNDTIILRIVEPLTVLITADPTSGYAPLTVDFTSTVSGGVLPYTYDWDFGDGIGTSTEPNPAYIYTRAGNYTATLVVTDSNMDTASDSVDIEVLPSVNNTSPYVEITYPEEGETIRGTVRITGITYDNDPGDEVEFVEVRIEGSWRMATLTGLRWYADFDTTTVPDGWHTIEARAFDGELYGYDDVTVYINNTAVEPLTVSITADPTIGYAPLTVQFNSRVNGGVPPYTYNWDFGDRQGIINGPPDPTHEYRRAGNFTAVLIVYDSTGDFATDSVDIEVLPTINNTAPEIEITEPDEGEVVSGLFVVLGNAWDNDPGDEVEYVEISIDGSDWDRAELTLLGWYYYLDTTQLSEGEHGIIARAYDGELYGYDEVRFYVDNIPSLTVTITADPTRGYAPLTVQFTSTVTGGIPPYKYEWDFETDGVVDSGEPNPTHIYTRAGNYTATLTVRDSELVKKPHKHDLDIATASIDIEVLPTVNTAPYVEILYPEHRETVSGLINVAGITYDNDPGDLVESVEVRIDGGAWEPAVLDEPAWSYILDTTELANGWHTIYARAFDGELYGYDRVRVYVENIHGLEVLITADPTSGNAPLTVQFTSTVTGGKKPYIYAWDFDNNGVIDSTDPNPVYTYYWPYTYTAKLYVFDADGKYGVASVVIDVTGKKPYKPEEEIPEGRPYILTISRIRILSHGVEVDKAEPGDELELIVNIKNTGEKDLKDVKVMFTIPDLGVRRTAGPFKLKQGKTATRHVYMELPYYSAPGEYDIRISVSSNEIRRVKYRWITVI